MKRYLVPALLAALLTACGGGGGGSSNPPPAPVALDAFTTLVSMDYAAANDTGEPNAIDSVAVTAPEATEPIFI